MVPLPDIWHHNWAVPLALSCVQLPGGSGRRRNAGVQLKQPPGLAVSYNAQPLQNSAKTAAREPLWCLFVVSR